MAHRKQWRTRAPGVTLIELLVAMVVGAIVMGALIQALIVGSRVTDQQSTQVDVHWYARQAVQKFSEDAREAYAVLRSFTVPSTAGWPDSGHTYYTTRETDLASTQEDDRFTVVFLMPSTDSSGSLILSPGARKIASFDAVVWTLTLSAQTVGADAVYKRLYELKRSVYPAAAFTETTYSYSASSNSVQVGTSVSLERNCVATVMAYNVVQASQDESSASSVGRLSRPMLSMRDSDGNEVAFSPKDLVAGGSELGNAQSPSSALAALTADQKQVLPLIRTGATAPSGNYAEVTHVSLVDLRLAVWEAATAAYGRTPTGDSGMISMYTSTNNRLRNKRDWN